MIQGLHQVIVYSRQGPTYDGSAHGVQFVAGVCPHAVSQGTADLLVSTGGFGSVPYRPGDDVVGWTNLGGDFIPIVEGRRVANPAPSCGSSCLPPLDVSFDHLPDRLPDDYMRLFGRYDSKGRLRR